MAQSKRGLRNSRARPGYPNREPEVRERSGFFGREALRSHRSPSSLSYAAQARLGSRRAPRSERLARPGPIPFFFFLAPPRHRESCPTLGKRGRVPRGRGANEVDKKVAMADKRRGVSGARTSRAAVWNEKEELA